MHCPCAEGWTCVDDVCVPDDEAPEIDAGGTSGLDGGSRDASVSARDSGTDASARDSGADATSDAGTPEDATPPEPLAFYPCDGRADSGVLEGITVDTMGCLFDGSVAEVPVALQETFTIFVDVYAPNIPDGDAGSDVILGQPIPMSNGNYWQFIDNIGQREISLSPHDVDVDGGSHNATVPLNNREEFSTIVLQRLHNGAFIAVTGSSPQFNHKCFSPERVETSTVDVTIGGDRNNGVLTNFFHGHLRNIRFYSPALSNAQLLELHGTLDAEDLEFTCP